MKKCISIVIISALLIQLVGCYSSNYITTAELKLLDGDEEINVTTFSKEGYTTNNWTIANDTLSFGTIVGLKLDVNNNLSEDKKNVLIPISEIELIFIEEIETTSTILFTVSIVGGLMLLLVTSNFGPFNL